MSAWWIIVELAVTQKFLQSLLQVFLYMKFYQDGEYKDSCEALFQRYEVSIKSLLPHVRIESEG
ncbi:MAG: hypothetical protein B0W54_23940 [Cellvibrio sp. 79]|nr:MAG: hypothetical protein B0W54_23940 [Cellvibrio sp. 79]